MTDRLKTVYPPKTLFCGGYKDYSLSELGARFDCNLNRWLVGTAYIKDTCMYDCMGTAPVFPMMFTFWSASLHDQNLLNLVRNLLLFDVLLLHVL